MRILKLAVLLLLPLNGYSQLVNYYPTVYGQLIEKQYYTLDYNEEAEQANWVIYAIHPFGKAERKDRFKSDPDVVTGSARLKDYKRSGYDRGHLAPAGDMKISSRSMKESFFLSNMSPQAPGFNRGIWKNLEARIRLWAKTANSNSDYVVVGPILSNNACGSIGRDVAIPCSFYRIYIDLDQEIAIAFILKNEPSNADLTNFVVSIDSVESVTGIDFFPSLPDSVEDDIEAMIRPDLFDFQSSEADFDISDIKAAVQCQAIAKNIAARCWRKTTNTNKYCFQHQDQVGNKSYLDLKVNNEIQDKPARSIRCRAKTQKGSRCKRGATSSGFCWQHE